MLINQYTTVAVSWFLQIMWSVIRLDVGATQVGSLISCLKFNISRIFLQDLHIRDVLFLNHNIKTTNDNLYTISSVYLISVQVIKK